MTMTTVRRRRLKVSYALHLQQQTAAVSNVVANVAPAVVDVSVRQWRLRRRTTRTPPEHVRSRRQLRQRRHQKEHFVNYFLTCYVLPGNDLRPVG